LQSEIRNRTPTISQIFCDHKKDKEKAGRLHSQQQQNTKFQLTSAELHMKNYYKGMDKTAAESAGKERS